MLCPIKPPYDDVMQPTTCRR